jgi:eukaryotic-like serine/threonine-protein kinase
MGNLKNWVNNNDPITQKIAINWLRQLVEQLETIHQTNQIYAEVYPVNIQCADDGSNLSLIPLGTEINIGEPNPGIIYAEGYTAPEIENDANASPQWDFFALGRTFVYLLTGTSPTELPRNQPTGELNWHSEAPQVEQKLTALIDDLMALSAQNRPQNTQEILQRLEENPPVPPSRSYKKLLILGGAVTFLILAAISIYWYLNGVKGCSRIWLREFPQNDNLSCGEEVLFNSSVVGQDPLPEKQAGVEEFADGNYIGAIRQLMNARKKEPTDPETLIYLNNALLMEQKAYTIAIVAPIGGKSQSRSVASGILRGIAQAQDEFNNNRKNSGEPGIKVLIANDDNNPNQAEAMAKVLVSKDDILAVVGHYASEITVSALPVYQNNQLVLISPGSTAEEIRTIVTPNDFFFRTVNINNVYAKVLADYLLNQAKKKTAAVFYNKDSLYSRSIKENFRSSFKGQVVKEFELSDPGFIADVVLDQAKKLGATALVLFPDGRVNPNSFDNTLNLIRANQGNLFMMGGATLYNQDVLLEGDRVYNKMILEVPWHRLSDPNQKFLNIAKDLWRTDNVDWYTSMSYDASIVLIEALKGLEQPTRLRIKETLANPNFQATGSSGEISFIKNGDRRETVRESVKVVPSTPECSVYKYMFVPVNYPYDEYRCKKS